MGLKLYSCAAVIQMSGIKRAESASDLFRREFDLLLYRLLLYCFFELPGCVNAVKRKGVSRTFAFPKKVRRFILFGNDFRAASVGWPGRVEEPPAEDTI